MAFVEYATKSTQEAYTRAIQWQNFAIIIFKIQKISLIIISKPIRNN